MTTPDGQWDLQEALQTYQIDRWGAGYFGVNDKGNISVSPLQEQGAQIDMAEVIEDARERGLKFPMLLRFQDLLRHRVQRLNEAFGEAIREAGYGGVYRGVFPIKVNQLREVVEEIVDAGAPYHHGLEVGSKPELFAGLAMHTDLESLMICNGYKDKTFIETALMGRKLGKTIIMVVEKIEELKAIIDISRNMNVEPMIGIRVRLSTKSGGKWALSGGENAKFGLSTAELLEAAEILRGNGMAHCFKLIHFHIGSQIPDIQTVKRAAREGARYYGKLWKEGFALGYLDVGGGLGVDYDGSRSANDTSINYTLNEYARDIVYNVAEICNEEQVPHPTLVSESGRAVVAHHSVLIVDVFGAIEKTKREKTSENIVPAHKLAADLLEIRQTLNRKNRRELFHDALQIKEDCEARFNLGLLDLQAKAQIETLFWEIAEEIVRHYRGAPTIPKEIRELEDSLGDQFLCNFSLFQSLIDHWALGQMFPIAPVHRLNEKPAHQGTLVDITCDSDGKISEFITGEEVLQGTLPLHAIDGRPYYLGIFLMGAYQDIMGDQHNLFGNVNEAHVFLDPDEEDGFYIEETIPGVSIGEMLASVQYDPHLIERAMKAQIDAAIKADVLKPNEGMRLLENYEKGLKGSTYLQFD
ncbi:arginine decarboxylase [Verrucomicrobium sp. GAS474]|uniref:biosynthetic arginine decarboxylase n=1 Tax=Verrucomicrobium sp. GAS474 TaxID=1882831 RepID=UPI00087A117D|nr:biosynthetic arginine decarboxylase [Verrucomicrobium sp. GAS474]SDU21662.1 arginine decarboxylase [Verrucomicrobium sp. GAS474]